MKYLIYAGIGILLVVVQVLISRFLSIAGVSPDLVLIFLMWLTISEGQFVGETSGFVLGLSLDLFSSGGILGAHALSKTIACFMVGYFFSAENAEQRVRNWPFFLLTLLGAVLNNVIYYFLTTRGTEIQFDEFAIRFGLVGALYTVFVSIFPFLYWSRKRTF